MIDYAVLVGFLILLIAIGRWAAGRVHTSLDYHLAGRRLGKWPVALVGEIHPLFFGPLLSVLALVLVSAISKPPDTPAEPRGRVEAI